MKGIKKEKEKTYHILNTKCGSYKIVVL